MILNSMIQRKFKEEKTSVNDCNEKEMTYVGVSGDLPWKEGWEGRKKKEDEEEKKFLKIFILFNRFLKKYYNVESP